MFGPTQIGTGLTLTKILGGLSKTLSIANQAIPIYKEIKPMIGNARKVMSVLKEFNNTSNSSLNTTKKTLNVDNVKEVTYQKVTSSNPVFFQ